MINKIYILFFIILVLAGIYTGKVHGQSNASATGHIFAEVISSFTATETSQLNFGRFSPGHEGGQIIVSPEGSVYTVGSVVVNGGGHNAASFEITGDNNAIYSVSLPGEAVTITSLSDSKSMLVTNWVSYPAPENGIGLLQGGSQFITIGATLMVSTINNNPSGIYSGVYVITFEFN